MKTSIVIPIFNGAELIEKNLPYVLQTKADEVIVIDDGSTDNSAEVLNKFASSIDIIKHEKNQGYGASVNDGFQKATGDIIFMLNTDVRPLAEFIAPVLPYFEKESTFAVTCHEPGLGWAYGEFRNGFLHHEARGEGPTAHISLYASGGSAAFSREKFMSLGMYDRIYHPFYWEDTDISYRAWKRGWEIWWEPNSIIEHERSSTIKKYFSKDFVNYIVQRNELFFLWKNVTDDDLFAQHKKALTNRLLNHPGYAKILFGALKRWSDIQSRRKIEKHDAKCTDKEIFARFVGLD